MKYNIVALADIHFDAFDPELQYRNLELFIIFLEKYRNVDMIVVAGDYFNSLLPLNSKSAILAIQWKQRLVKVAKEVGVKAIREIRGTKEHDHLQLEAFRELEDESGFYKLFNENTYEETLPGLRCIYCPDENINAKDYKKMYIDNILQFPNIGFFHGSFDIVLPDIVVQLSEETSLKNIIYEYDFWSKIVQGPMISGHWHDGNHIDSLIYLGSYDRWAFNEMNDKGFGFIQMDTETNKYFYKKIVNEFAAQYLTFTIDTHLYHNIDEYTLLIKEVEKVFAEKDLIEIRVRVVINVTDEKPLNETLISSIRQYFINNKLVKIVIKNKIKTNKKEEKKKKNIEVRNKYGFIFDKSLKEAEIIQQFILETKDKYISIDKIKNIVDKLIK